MWLDCCQRYVFKIQLDKNNPVGDIDIQGIKFGLGDVGPVLVTNQTNFVNILLKAK